jgi:hypothetical protein
MTDLSTPTMTQSRLEEIENDLAMRQNLYEAAARAWFVKQGKITKDRAVAYRTASGGSTEKKEAANELHGEDGALEQGEYEALRAVIKVLETRATIGMSILKSQGRT